MVICDYCGNKAAQVTGRKIYPHRPDLFSLRFWHCEPCKAWVGCHKIVMLNHSAGLQMPNCD